MKVEYINPFITAVRALFDTMIDLPLELGKPFIKKENVPDYEISSMIGLSGSVTGCVSINISKDLGLILASELLGDHITEIDADCTDAIGEIANMIAGNAKTDFPSEGVTISVPTVVVGKHKVAFPSGIPIVSIPCNTGKGQLMIDVALKESS